LPHRCACSADAPTAIAGNYIPERVSREVDPVPNPRWLWLLTIISKGCDPSRASIRLATPHLVTITITALSTPISDPEQRHKTYKKSG
jgi:hypothetical protein